MKRLFDIKKYKKNVSTVCVVLFAALCGGYVLFHILGGFTDKLRITPATVASENVYEYYDAYIFRDEHIISSQKSGYRLDMCADGEMAGIGTEFARVYADARGADFSAKLEELEKTIAFCESCCVNLSSGGILDSKNTLRDGYASIAEALTSKYPSRALAYSSRILTAFGRLEVNTGRDEAVEQNIEILKGEIKALKAERDELIASLGGDYESLTATKTGYYYSGVDGYEEAMTSRGIESKTLSEFFASINSLSENFSYEGEGNAVGRMVYDSHWYAAVTVPMEIAVNYLDEEGDPKGGTYGIEFYDGEWKTLGMALERVVQSPEDTRAILLFSASEMKIGFEGGRVRRVRMHTAEYVGYRVPKQALHERGGENGVYILTYGTVEWRKVEVIYSGESYVLVAKNGGDTAESSEWLALNDSLIVEGKDLYHGKTVD